MAAQIAAMASFIQNLQIPPGVDPAIVNLPIPPKLDGALAPNTWLAKAQKHALNKVQGPESLLVLKNGHMFTGTADGHLVHIKPNGSVSKLRRFATPECGKSGAPEGACGRPMGIRLDNLGLLLIADAFNGIYRLNQYTGETALLVNAKTDQVNGQPLGFINDLVVDKDGTIFFTSSSNKWPMSRSANIIFEAENSGRVLVFKDGKLTELVSKLSFPTGLELSADGTQLLIAEGTFSRIWRAWVSGPKKGSLEVFTTNLPGVVDNIRRSPRGTYWVAMSQARHSQLPSVLDKYGEDRRVRAALITMVDRKISFPPPKFGVVVELDQEGKIIRSLQDPTGSVYTGVSEAQEVGRYMFFASPNRNFIGFLNMDVVNGKPKPSPSPPTPTPSPTPAPTPTTTTAPPPPADLPTEPATATTTAAPTTGADSNVHPLVRQFMTNLLQNFDKMELTKKKQVAVEVLREIMKVRYQSRLMRQWIANAKQNIQRLQQQQQQQQQQPASAATTAPPVTTTATPTVPPPPPPTTPTTQPPPITTTQPPTTTTTEAPTTTQAPPTTTAAAAPQTTTGYVEK